MKIEHEATEPNRHQPVGDDVERRLLLCDEHDPLTISDGARDQVGDRLGFSCARWPLDNNGAPRQGLSDDTGLRGICRNGQPCHQIVKVDRGGCCLRVGEGLRRGLNEVAHQRIVLKRLPGILKVLPQTKPSESEDAEEHGRLDTEWEFLINESLPNGVNDLVDIDPGGILLWFLKTRNDKSEVNGEPFEQ